MNFKAPYLTFNDVGKYADDLLKKYHPSLKLPIPIEPIIEFDLNLQIVPIPNLWKIFRQSGYLSADRTRIFIDEYQYDNYVEKYRFTLAHEVGHYLIHESLYEGFSFNSVQEYIEFYQNDIPQKDLYWFETHGEWFAEQLLVPESCLESHCIDLLESDRRQFFDGDCITHQFWSYASNVLAESFEVSPQVVEIRIRHAGFIEKFRDYYLRK
ncbi:MAG: ImmA/IrrE family metallo-endopeptidase [Desulfobacteraceae bacterium]|nr:MAG: ImmA/IrrE family metallo-endopeptidase [Desulfobacteraceae bacterium]